MSCLFFLEVLSQTNQTRHAACLPGRTGTTMGLTAGRARPAVVGSVAALLVLLAVVLAPDAAAARPLRTAKERCQEESGLGTTFHVLSWSPRVVLVKRFADPKDVQVYIDTASPKMKVAGLSLRPGEAFNASIRTSTGAFVEGAEDATGTIRRLEEKLAALTGIPTEMGEAWNVLHYPLNGHYAHHLDYFDPKVFPDSGKNNRLATFLLYLKSPEAGGETIFPKTREENGYKGGEAILEFDSCDRGLKVRAEPGDGVLFFSQTPDLVLDPRSLHGGCPVAEGEKWVATKWMHNFSWGNTGEPGSHVSRETCLDLSFDIAVDKVAISGEHS